MGLAERIAEFGDGGYLVTVGGDGRPHVVAVTIVLDGAQLVVAAGRRTSENVAAHPAVSLLWAAPAGAGYCLIVDGTARLDPPSTLRIAPTRAVLHRTPEGDPAEPSCITVLSAS